jgi:hypothetical protein
MNTYESFETRTIFDDVWRYTTPMDILMSEDSQQHAAKKINIQPLSKLQKLKKAMERWVPSNYSNERKEKFLNDLVDSIKSHWKIQ